MTKIRRGGYVFITWIGDHAPRHVHVYRSGQFVMKWDLDHDQPMNGKPTRRVIELIQVLKAEKKL